MPDAQKWSPASQFKLKLSQPCEHHLRPTSSRHAIVMQRVFKGIHSKQRPDRTETAPIAVRDNYGIMCVD